ncbi:MAG: M20/M25/M40 family metallo-hydrolase [Thermoguttaceae bacterium]
MNRRLLQRFLRYVKIDTTARGEIETYPSSPGQLKLGRLLVKELQALGISDAQQDRYGIVMATIPATADEAPTIAWCAHLDTSPETTGKDVRPQVVRNYQGGDLALPASPDRVIRAADNPQLDALRGRTLITTDGTTLLGADDKAGVAVIMEAAARLMDRGPAQNAPSKGTVPFSLRPSEACRPKLGQSPQNRRHGPIRLLFTCDEEIGRGVDYVAPAQIGAVVCYTLDGQGTDMIDVETFSADLAVVTIYGVNIHPSIAKGRMVNAIRVSSDFLGRLPRDRLSPESTEDREGFLHAYEIQGGVGGVKLRILLRDFDAQKLEDQARFLSQTAEASLREFPGARITVEIKPQYRNMAAGLAGEPRAVAYAQRALERLARQAKLALVRGGTDGARLTELGLPSPNLSCGAYTPHSVLEWACLEQMAESVDWLLALAEVWAEKQGASAGACCARPTPHSP